MINAKKEFYSLVGYHDAPRLYVSKLAEKDSWAQWAVESPKNPVSSKVIPYQKPKRKILSIITP